MAKSIQEQIVQFETKRAASEARRADIMAKAADEGRTLDPTESEEYDGLTSELKTVDEHIVRLKAHEVVMVSGAQRVTVDSSSGAEHGIQARSGAPIQVRSNAPKGIGMARMAIAIMKAKGLNIAAADLAKKHWPDMPEVELTIRGTIEAGDTTTSGWASQLLPAAQQMQQDFLELLRPATIIGRIPGLRAVPFNVAVPVQTGGGTYGWVGEAKAKPVTKLTFDRVTLRWAKAAGIIVITKELAQFSSPSAELLVRNDMVKGVAQFLDGQFVDPAVAIDANVSPASITNLISPTAATGTTAAAFRYDLAVLFGKFITNSQDPTNAVLLMSATVAMGLSQLMNALGQPEFPNITMKGGTIDGIPVIVAENVGARIVLVNASDILLAEDNGITIDVSDQASVEMSAPSTMIGDTSPIVATTVIKSLWQNNLVGLRVERYITWLRGRDSAVEFISGAAYAPAHP